MEDLSNKFNELSVAPKVNTNDEAIKAGNSKGKLTVSTFPKCSIPPKSLTKQKIIPLEDSGLGEDTVLLMFDGTAKPISEVKTGDQLMGPDSRSRIVLSTIKDIRMLYEIIPNKGVHIFCTSNHKFIAITNVPYITRRYDRPSSYVVNYIKNNLAKQKAFLTEEDANKFIETKSDNLLLTINICNYLKCTDKFKHHTYMYHCGLNFIEKEIPIDPYMIGFWLGDGTSAGAEITNVDRECLDYFRNNLGQYNLELSQRKTKDVTYGIRTIGKSSPGSNKFLTALQDLNLLNNKHIPDIYKMNSRDIRLKVLAGLIDSDGYLGNNCIEIHQKNKKLSDDIEFLCFSLGFMITRVECEKGCMYKNEMRYGIYQRMNIFGEGMEEIPIILERKKTKERGINKRATCHGFKISSQTTEAPCFNIQISGDHRFLLRDFTIMHDSS